MGHTATSLLREGERVTGVVVRPREGAERKLSARLVVGADGRSSGIGKLAGQKTKTRANNRFVYMAYYRDTPLISGDQPQMWFLDPDMAYAFPTDDELTMLACVAAQGPHRRNSKRTRRRRWPACTSACRTGLASTPPSGSRRPRQARRAQRTPPARTGRGSLWSATPPSPPTRSGGSGCGWALQSGEWLAEEAGPALGDEAELDRALRRYARRHRGALAEHDRFCSAYSSGPQASIRPKSSLFRGAARDDELAGRFALVGERWIKPRQLLTPSMLGLMLRANLGRGRTVDLAHQGRPRGPNDRPSLRCAARTRARRRARRRRPRSPRRAGRRSRRSR